MMAMTKCVTEPAVSTTTRCQVRPRQKARGASAGSSSSSGVMPVILTNPPAGMALTPYSVSPRCRLNSVGPKPTKNCVAFMPKARAVRK